MAFTREQIEPMLEHPFRQDVLVPLLTAMGYSDVRIRHSSGELGKDIIGWKNDTWGNRENWAVVGKAVKLTGKASTVKGSVSEIQTQIFEAFGDPFDDPITAEKCQVDRVLVACNKPIGREFIAALGAILRATNRSGQVEIWDNQRVWELYEQYVVPPIHKVLRTQVGIADFDPHYSLDVHMAGDTTTIGLRERYPGAAEQEPLTGKLSFAFQDSPDDQEALRILQRFRATGEEVEIAGAHVRELNFPIIKKILGVDLKVDTLWMTSVPDIPPVPARVEIRNIDGDAFIFPSTLLHVIHGGEDEITISDEPQPGPVHIVIKRNWKTETLHISFPHAIEFPIEAPTLHMLLWLRRCLSKPFRIMMTDPNTGAPVFNIGDQLMDGIVKSPEDGDLSLAEDLTTVQLVTGQRIVIPSGEFSAEDVEALNLLRGILRHGRLKTDWTGGTITAPKGEVAGFLGDAPVGNRWFAKIEPASMRLFGHDIPLGRARYAHCARLVNEQDVRELLSQDLDPGTPIELQWEPPDEPIEVDDGRMVPGNTVIVDYLDWKQDKRLDPEAQGRE